MQLGDNIYAWPRAGAALSAKLQERFGHLLDTAREERVVEGFDATFNARELLLRELLRST